MPFPVPRCAEEIPVFVAQLQTDRQRLLLANLALQMTGSLDGSSTGA
jgi:hypothetical protein